MPTFTQRPDWDTYFGNLASAVAERADCRRRRVGAVIVDTEHRTISTGYNGSPPGGPSCLKGECPRGVLDYAEQPAGGAYDNCHAVHAEMNAIIFARENLSGMTIYITDEPCAGCRKAMDAAGIQRVVVKGQ